MEGPVQELRSSEVFGHRREVAIAPWGGVRSLDLQPGLRVSLVSFRADRPFEVTAYNDDATGMHFSCMFGGPMEVGHGGRRLTLGPGSLLTSYAPGERFEMRFSAEHSNLEVMIRPDTLATLAGPDFGPIAEDVRRGFCFHSVGRDRRVADAASRLARLMTEDGASHLLRHGAAMEFLAWHLGRYGTGGRRDGALSARDERRVLMARDRLLQDLADPPTIADLARETGLNQFKLKRGFKALFGCGIYALFQRERMDQARLLLRTHGVTETAMLLGYSNASHFSTAFRKQFGVLPREARRGTLD